MSRTGSRTPAQMLRNAEGQRALEQVLERIENAGPILTPLLTVPLGTKDNMTPSGLSRAASHTLISATVLLVCQVLATVCHAQVNVTEFERNYWDYASPVADDMRQAQRRWWEQIGQATDGDPSRMARLLTSNNPRFFSRSCEQPAIAGDYERLQMAFATVMASGVSNPRSAASDSQIRGRFLACLANSGAEPLKAKILGRLIEWTTSPALRYTPVSCDWKPQAGAMVAASGHWLSGGEIRWYGTSALADNKGQGYYPPDRAGSTASSTFANMALHELIHAAGYSGEELAYTAVACCGDVVADRAKACNSLDAVIARDRTAYLLSSALGRSQYFRALEPKFPGDEAEKLAQRFYRLLAKTLPDLAGVDGRSACIARSGLAACRAKAATAVGQVLATIFPEDCVNLVSGRSEGLCSMVKDDEQKTLARRITDRFFP